jgi:hypothetical protein
MTEREPTPAARAIAFKILRKHPECLRDDVVMNDLIDDIAAAIDSVAAEVESVCGETAPRKTGE